MRIGVIGAGHIGGNCARQAVKAGHEVMLSFARDPAKLEELAAELGERASTGTPRAAVEFGEMVIVSVPWGAIPAALEQAGDLSGKLVVDTTNQFGAGPMPAPGQTAAAFNAGRMSGARYTKSFNTLTAGFQAEAEPRSGALGTASCMRRHRRERRGNGWEQDNDLSLPTRAHETEANRDRGPRGTAALLEALR